MITSLSLAILMAGGFLPQERPPADTPERIALANKAGEHRIKAYKLLDEGKLDEAEAEFHLEIAILQQIRTPPFSALYGLARVAHARNDTPRELSLYRQIAGWDSTKEDLVASLGLVDYGLLLCRLGKLELAKQLHYAQMRGY